MVIKKKMKIGKRFWNWISGKKTIIGMVVWVAAKGGKMFFPNAIPDEAYEAVKWGSEILMGGGLVHKGFKSKTVVDAVKKGVKIFAKK
jgi:hypothetical protein